MTELNRKTYNSFTVWLLEFSKFGGCLNPKVNLTIFSDSLEFDDVTCKWSLVGIACRRCCCCLDDCPSICTHGCFHVFGCQRRCQITLQGFFIANFLLRHSPVLNLLWPRLWPEKGVIIVCVQRPWFEISWRRSREETYPWFDRKQERRGDSMAETVGKHHAYLDVLDVANQCVTLITLW